MCSRVAGAVLPRPHVGSKSVLILESLSLDLWRWCTTLKCITDHLRDTDELEIFIETCSQVVSGIVSPSSPSHPCLRPSKLVSLWSLNTVYILHFIFFESVLFLSIRSSREVEGCIGKHSEVDVTKHLICKYLKNWNQRKSNFWDSSSKETNLLSIYKLFKDRIPHSSQPWNALSITEGVNRWFFLIGAPSHNSVRFKGFSEWITTRLCVYDGF